MLQPHCDDVHVCWYTMHVIIITMIIIATFILRTYPSREDVQGAYRSGYIIIGT